MNRIGLNVILLFPFFSIVNAIGFAGPLALNANFRVQVKYANQSTADEQNTIVLMTAGKRDYPRGFDICVANGQSAFVKTGKIKQRSTLTVTPTGVTTLSSEDRPVSSGFWLKVQQIGQKVQVSISEKNQRLNSSENQTVDEQTMATVVIVPFNHWTAIGGRDDKLAKSNYNIYTIEKSSRTDNRVYVRILPSCD